MKNKFYYILLCLLVGFSFVNVVSAKELEFTMSPSVSNTEVVVGGEATITINLKSNSAIANCWFNIEADSTLEFVSKNGMNNWGFQNYEGNGRTIIENSSLDNIAYTNGKNIFNLKYKVNGNGKVSIKNIECVSLMSEGVDEEGNETEIEGSYSDITVNFTTKQVSEDTTLSSLNVTGGKLLSEFFPNNYEYMIELDNPNFSLSMTASNADYQDDIVVTDASGKTLDPNNITYNNDGGQGLMKMNVSINGNKQYELIARYMQEGLDNSLTSLKINGTEIQLSSDKLDYTFEIKGNVNEINVEAVLKDSTNFQFREGNGPGVFSKGTTSIALMIEPKNSQVGGDGKTYNIELIYKTDSGNNGGSSSNVGNNNGGNTNTNPSTGGISMFVMVIILFLSLIGSIFLYQRNLQSYK